MKRRKKWLKSSFSMVVSLTALMTVGCGGEYHGTRVLYETENGARKPADAVARIIMHDLESLEKKLVVNCDTPENIDYVDTLELLPGSHQLTLRQVTKRDMSTTSQLFLPSSAYQACLKFAFNAEAGHVYDFRLVEYSVEGWTVDLIDRNEPRRTIHGVSCPIVKKGSRLYD